MSSSGFLRILDDEKIADETNNSDIKNDQLNKNSEHNDSVIDDTPDNQEPTQFEENSEQNQTEDSSEEETREKTGSLKWNKLKAIQNELKQVKKERDELFHFTKLATERLKSSEVESLLNYGNSTIARFKNAEEAYKAALTNGTPDDITAATANYTMALHDYNDAEKKVKEYQIKKDSPSAPNIDTSEQEANYKRALQQEWLNNNPELNARSPYYNPKLEQVIISEAEKLNNYLHNEGLPHLIGSEEYLDKLEEYVEYFKNEGVKNLKGYSTGNRNKGMDNASKVNLTPVEANIAASLNMTHAEYKASQARMPESLRTKQQMLRR